MENRNPNFSTWEAQNAWESYINNKLNNKPIIKEREWKFIQSSEFDNRYRHTDSFLYYDKNAFRVDYKAVTWNSKNDKGEKICLIRSLCLSGILRLYKKREIICLLGSSKRSK